MDSQHEADKLQMLIKRAQVYAQFLADRLQLTVKQATTTEVGSGLDDKDLGGFQGTLKPFQEEGVRWLLSLWENGLNGMLADEMGLGKTVQCLCLLLTLKNRGIPGPFLIVVPASTIAQWRGEAERFTPALRVHCHYGPERRRGRRALVDDQAILYLTTYEIAMRDLAILKRVTWKYLVVDEGHRLKNHDCKLMSVLKRVPCDNRLLLTGTPLQNSLPELWSLLNFLLPTVFDSLDEFERWFDLFSTSQASAASSPTFDRDVVRSWIEGLHTVLRPFVLRRLKAQVLGQLAPKREYTVYVPLTRRQLVLYARISSTPQSYIGPSNHADSESLRDNRNLQNNSGDDGQEVDVNGDDSEDYDQVDGPLGEPVWYGHNRVMQLRKVCNHPLLLSPPINNNNNNSSTYSAKDLDAGGKVPVLRQLLQTLIDDGHRILLYSQMTHMLDILECILRDMAIRFLRIDGSTPTIDRAQIVQEFTEDDGVKVFLLSTRAAGLGLNLSAADTVIFYDSDWNPQVDRQAMDRVHRIGQTRPVLGLRLCSLHPSVIDNCKPSMHNLQSTPTVKEWTSDRPMTMKEWTSDRPTVEERMRRVAKWRARLGDFVVHRRRFASIRLLDEPEKLEDDWLSTLDGPREPLGSSGREPSARTPIKTRLSAKALDILRDRSPPAYTDPQQCLPELELE